jgi:hypothetical protein
MIVRLEAREHVYDRSVALRTWAVTALSILAALIVVGCGGQGDGEPRVTLTEDGCTYDGEETPAAKDDFGRFDIAVENRTPRFADFAIVRLARDVAFDEVEPLIASGKAAFPARSATAPALAAARILDRGFFHTEVDRTSSGVLTVDQPTGRYVVICRILRASASCRHRRMPRRPSPSTPPAGLS